MSNYWAPFETRIDAIEDLERAINEILIISKEGRQFAWRGQVNSDWPLHSSLYRRLKLTKDKVLPEKDIFESEGEILKRLHRWGLHNISGRGRLSVLNQLALLQHYGAPTRLIDISFNAWVGVFFAVEEKWSNGQLCQEEADGRLFAIDVTDRIINENNKYRRWEDELNRPWGDKTKIDQNSWSTTAFAWKPASLDSRIFAQNGGFLFGGVPSSSAPNGKTLQFPKGPKNEDGNWSIDEVRSACSIAARQHKFDSVRGATPKNPMYTFRIRAELKKEIRNRLELMYGFKHSTIYPDYTGFSEFALPEIKRF